MSRKCKMCQKEFHGRSDKVFCSIHCKSEYHLKLRRATAKEVNEINKILARNRSILLEILGKNAVQKKFERLLLDKKKFNYKYHTHILRNSKGKLYFYVYDIAWMEFSDNEILIARKKK
ncbi:MAG: hypothetical protein JXR51_12930 [Bacteroidales bacterium]|nr:hypothetical protein [Bacteroidales bacterium]MBN2758074.1 hypothetical protein [Bacteroidales bacterium]